MTLTNPNPRKPRIHWRYYPSLQRGYWGVSPMPRKMTKSTHYVWTVAHLMADAMNKQVQYRDK